MKKTYTKPIVAFENFQIISNFAAGCAQIVTTLAEGTCGIPVLEDLIVFSDNSKGDCNALPDESLDDFACYHSPTSDTKLFNS